MTAMLERPVAITLTPQEYDALPPDSRMELVDGVLDVMPTPTVRHQLVGKKLERQLEAVCPEQLLVLREQEIKLEEALRRNPDLLVVKASAVDLDQYSFAPADVLLAVEVVSPGTQTRDRKHKPAEYAAAGVPHYWRVEISPAVAVHTYQLGETGVYLETGLFAAGDVTAVPGLAWAKFEVSGLEPR